MTELKELNPTYEQATNRLIDNLRTYINQELDHLEEVTNNPNHITATTWNHAQSRMAILSELQANLPHTPPRRES